MGYHVKIKLAEEQFKEYKQENCLHKNKETKEIKIIYPLGADIEAILRDHLSKGHQIIQNDYVSISDAYSKYNYIIAIKIFLN